jgi:hypothetical protein
MEFVCFFLLFYFIVKSLLCRWPLIYHIDHLIYYLKMYAIYIKLRVRITVISNSVQTGEEALFFCAPFQGTEGSRETSLHSQPSS